MNAVLKVDRTGHLSTVAVLPPQPVTLTQPMVEALAAEFGARLDAFDLPRRGDVTPSSPCSTDVEATRTAPSMCRSCRAAPRARAPRRPRQGLQGQRLDRGAHHGRERTARRDGTSPSPPMEPSTPPSSSAGKVNEVPRTASGPPPSPSTGRSAVEVHGGYLYVGHVRRHPASEPSDRRSTSRAASSASSGIRRHGIRTYAVTERPGQRAGRSCVPANGSAASVATAPKGGRIGRISGRTVAPAKE